MTANGLTAIDGERAPGGWEWLWATDRWPLRELPHADLHSGGRGGAILFDRIAQLWLKEAAKRWARSRLLAGGAPSTAASFCDSSGREARWPTARSSAAIG